VYSAIFPDKPTTRLELSTLLPHKYRWGGWCGRQRSRHRNVLLVWAPAPKQPNSRWLLQTWQAL